MTQAPRIGITTYRERAAWGVWDEPADLLPASYSEAVRAAGGGVFLLPPGDPTTAPAMLDGLHGLVIAGGADVEPARYDATRDPHTGAPREDRDGWELALVTAALTRDLPLLGVCRGMQVLNVALGGTLIQHLPDRLGHEDHCPTVGRHGRHLVELAPAGRLTGVLGDRTEVATYHHQAVDRIGANLDAVGWAEDGTVEALEHTGCTWAFGVQWHPEVHDGDAIFGALVTAAVHYRERNG